MSKKMLAAMAAAGLCATIASPALAQNAAATTAGGDVTADEATPLPPIVVQSPSEPIRRKTRRSTASTPSAAPGVVFDDSEGFDVEGSDAPTVGAFTLGQLDSIGGSTITNEAMYTFNTQSLDQAVNLLPGVTLQNTGGTRNERDIYVRGFDRLRVPLYMDGVRINLPYDNRLDMSRFLTPDLAEIQVQKGYVSVLNGPGGMGGAINLVSRKPTKAVELEGRAGVVTNGDLDGMNQWSSYAYAGTRQKGWYAQVSGTIVDRDQFSLSKDFTPAGPTTLGFLPGFPYEDGGDRDNSAFQDWRINAKVGITPNATDEYSINYTHQESRKDAPLHTHRQIVTGYQQGQPRFWQWPQWDISTLSWMSKTQLGSDSYVKTNAYYNTFDNILRFNSFNFARRNQDSIYSDNSYGGFIEMGTELIPMNTLKGSVHYRRDVHDSFNFNYNPPTGRTATETHEEETWSFAAENTFHATRNLDIVTGVSYDTNEVLRAHGTLSPLPELDKWSWQGAAIYSYSRNGKVHASVSSRVRFPTLFDRYSNRFGTRSEEPGLDAERATNYEIGISDTLFGSLNVSSAVFYSDIESTIQSAYMGANGNNSLAVYNADGEHYGFEISADWDATRTLRIGGNYTYLERDLDFRGASMAYTPPPAQGPGDTNRIRTAILGSQVEGTPRHSLFLYAAWKPIPQLTLTPSAIISSDRNVLVTSCESTLVALGSGGNNQQVMANGNCGKTSGFTGTPSYKRLGDHALVNFQAEYEFNDNASMAVGVTNLFDQNYGLAEGFPEPGRQFYANARVKF